MPWDWGCHGATVDGLTWCFLVENWKLTKTAIKGIQSWKDHTDQWMKVNSYHSVIPSGGVTLWQPYPMVNSFLSFSPPPHQDYSCKRSSQRISQGLISSSSNRETVKMLRIFCKFKNKSRLLSILLLQWKCQLCPGNSRQATGSRTTRSRVTVKTYIRCVLIIYSQIKKEGYPKLRSNREICNKASDSSWW